MYENFFRCNSAADISFPMKLFYQVLAGELNTSFPQFLGEPFGTLVLQPRFLSSFGVWPTIRY